MIQGAQKMLEYALKEQPDLIILTEGSDSCGTNIILDPKTEYVGKYKFQRGKGLAAALLEKNGFNILGHMNEVEIYNLLSSKLGSFPKMDGLKKLENLPFCPK
jgi:uncharacterized protein YbbK (DUF523 family)